MLYAAEAPVKSGRWAVVQDATAAGGSRLTNADARERKLKVARSSPKDYFEITFYAEAKRPYRLWVRGKAEDNSPYNDSVFVQFSNSVDQDGDEIYRINSQSAATSNLEDCLSCGLSGWGWQDNGWGESSGGSFTSPKRGRKLFACKRARTDCRSTKSSSRHKLTEIILPDN
ncbi:MAG TPA: hypothetical protein VM870_02585 [Pyrinomonadaceae bacterium]|nr:hypothetical protein [Pyrinomonadaceae bacterium]